MNMKINVSIPVTPGREYLLPIILYSIKIAKNKVKSFEYKTIIFYHNTNYFVLSTITHFEENEDIKLHIVANDPLLNRLNLVHEVSRKNCDYHLNLGCDTLIHPDLFVLFQQFYNINPRLPMMAFSKCFVLDLENLQSKVNDNKEMTISTRFYRSDIDIVFKSIHDDGIFQIQIMEKHPKYVIWTATTMLGDDKDPFSMNYFDYTRNSEYEE